MGRRHLNSSSSMRSDNGNMHNEDDWFRTINEIMTDIATKERDDEEEKVEVHSDYEAVVNQDANEVIEADPDAMAMAFDGVQSEASATDNPDQHSSLFNRDVVFEKMNTGSSFEKDNPDRKASGFVFESPTVLNLEDTSSLFSIPSSQTLQKQLDIDDTSLLRLRAALGGKELSVCSFMTKKHGVYCDEDGSTYEGQWKDDRRHGQGK